MQSSYEKNYDWFLHSQNAASTENFNKYMYILIYILNIIYGNILLKL